MHLHRIPIAHICEKTTGSLDDTLDIKFPKCQIYILLKEMFIKILIQLGENSKDIIVAGSLARERIRKKFL